MEIRIGKRALHLIGNLAAGRSNLPRAEVYFKRVKKLHEEIEAFAGVASCLNTIGALSSRTGRSHESLQCFSEALALGKRTGDREVEGIAFQGMGLAHNHLGNLDEAFDLLLKAQVIFEELRRTYALSYLLSNIGNVFGTIPDYPRAIEYYEKATAIAERISDNYSLANNCVNLGYMHIALGDFEHAIAALTRGVELGRKIENPICYASGIEALANVNLRQGHVERALEQIEEVA